MHTQPAGSGTSVVRYLARCVSKTASSDERMIAADDDVVRFACTDTRTEECRECTLTAEDKARQREEGWSAAQA